MLYVYWQSKTFLSTLVLDPLHKTQGARDLVTKHWYQGLRHIRLPSTRTNPVLVGLSEAVQVSSWQRPSAGITPKVRKKKAISEIVKSIITLSLFISSFKAMTKQSS